MKVVASSLVGLLLLLWSNRSCADSSVGSDPPSTDRPFESLGLGPGPLDGAAGGPPKSPRKSSSVASDLLPLPINNTNCGGSSSSNATNRKRPKGSTSSLQGALRSRSIGPGTNLLSHSPSPPSETARESSNHSLCQDAQPEQSEEVSACTAVAEETAVTQEPSTTFRLELDLLATASKAKSMGFQLRQALQSQIAPILTSCNDRDRRLVEGPSNVVFGKLSVEDLRECPDPSGDRSAASCLTATGMVSVYGAANGFAAALSSAATTNDALQVDGLIDIFFCRVINATDEEPVPEGANYNNASTTDPNASTVPKGETGSDSASSSVSKLPPIAYIGISVAILLVVCVILLAIRRHQASASQLNESAKDDDDGNDTDSSSEFATENMKINGFASVSRSSREDDDDDETSYASPTIEERIIDEEYDSEGGEDDDNVVIVPVYRFVAALEINPTEDE